MRTTYIAEQVVSSTDSFPSHGTRVSEVATFFFVAIFPTEYLTILGAVPKHPLFGTAFHLSVRCMVW